MHTYCCTREMFLKCRTEIVLLVAAKSNDSQYKTANFLKIRILYNFISKWSNEMGKTKKV